MTAATSHIIDTIRPELHKIVPAGSKVMLFGSRARGDENVHSDIDILVLLSHEDNSPDKNHDEIVYPIYMALWNHNLDANVLLYTQREWESKRGKSLLFHNVMEEAVEI